MQPLTVSLWSWTFTPIAVHICWHDNQLYTTRPDTYMKYGEMQARAYVIHNDPGINKHGHVEWGFTWHKAIQTP